MNFGVARRADPVLDVTPMIDIVFQLVLFFMVSTTFITTPGLEVELPRSASESLVSETHEIDVWITEDGTLYVNTVRIELEQIGARIQSLAQGKSDMLVVVRADRGVEHGAVVAVMDTIRALGLTRFAIATAPASEQVP